MASIMTAIELQDNFTSIMYGIIGTMHEAAAAASNLQNAMNETAMSAPYESIPPDIDAAAQEQANFNQQIQRGAEQSNHLARNIMRAVGAYMSIRTVGEIINVSDEMTQTTARLNQMNDEAQTTQELMEMVYVSAQDARGEFSEMASVVARFGNNAKDAFGSSAEVVSFANLIQKQMVLAGASTQEASAATIQLAQGLGSGVLRGDELNSVFEQAPNLIQNIADYLDVPIGQIRDMASEGQLTADIVKSAIFSAADEINANFEEMPMTWNQAWVRMKNAALMNFQPVLQRINAIVNSDQFQEFANNAIQAMAMVADFVLDIFDVMGQVGEFVADNWLMIGPIVYGVAAALAIYVGWLITYNAVQGITNFIQSVSAAHSAMKAGATLAEAAATTAATGAQIGLNAAMYACPIMWIIILIIALIAAFIMLWDNCEGFRNFFIDSWATSAKAVGGFYNGVIVPVANGIISVQNDLLESVREKCILFVNLIAETAKSIVENVRWVTDILSGMIGVYNKIVGVFGGKQINADFLLSAEGIDTVRDAAINNINSAIDVVKYDPFKEIDLDKYNQFIDGMADRARDFTFSGFIENALSELFGGEGIPDPEDYMKDYPYDDSWEGIADGLGDISDDTGSIVDALDVTTEELKYLRDLAEQKVINRFTTAEITINQTNNNNISSEMDLDGVMTGLTDAVNEAVDSVTEGVHK